MSWSTMVWAVLSSSRRLVRARSCRLHCSTSLAWRSLLRMVPTLAQGTVGFTTPAAARALSTWASVNTSISSVPILSVGFFEAVGEGLRGMRKRSACGDRLPVNVQMSARCPHEMSERTGDNLLRDCPLSVAEFGHFSEDIAVATYCVYTRAHERDDGGGQRRGSRWEVRVIGLSMSITMN